jgi:hypothetical protein
VNIKREATSLSFPIGKAECKAQTGSRLDARLLLQGFLVSMELYWDRRMVWNLAGITSESISIRSACPFVVDIDCIIFIPFHLIGISVSVVY